MNRLSYKSTLLFISSFCLLSLGGCNSSIEVKSTNDLIAATKNPKIHTIKIANNLTNVPTIRLAPTQTLIGTNNKTTILFANNVDGLQLTSDNTVKNINLHATPTKRAIFNDKSVKTLGKITLKDITSIGQVQILARDKVRSGKLVVNNLDIIEADTHSQNIKPHGYNAYITQGAFTLWNMQTDKNVILNAELKGISAGRTNAPVYGSGILISGSGFKDNGQIKVSTLQTEAIYTNGKIPVHTPSQITAAVFTAYGTKIKEVNIEGPIITYGINDFILSNWGSVDQWTVEEKLLSHGDNSSGFVNFGDIKKIKVIAPIETFGEGAHGFAVYDGSVKLAEFDHIITHDDGAVGIQVNDVVDHLIVKNGIDTFGGAIQAFIKGKPKSFSATGLSVRHGGLIHKAEINGGITTHAKDISPIELYGGNIEKLNIEDSVKALGDK